nr:reverse transcriptase domain-containing protein [Tanacetum cinerariifolium]
MLRAPTEGCAKAIIVPPILAEQFELKHSLISMMTSEQFFGLKKDNPHDHVRWFNKITSTIKYKDVPNSVIKLILFPFSLAGAATWDDLVSKFINEFFHPSRTTNLRNEISNFQQKFDESFHEAWETYKDLLRACPHHGFIELHQLDTFYNALNPADQDSLNAAADAKLTHVVNQQTSAVTTAMTAMLKRFQSNPPLTQVKAVEEICVTYGGAHSYYQCIASGGNTFPEYQDNIQGYISAAAGNYNQGNLGYRPQGVANHMRPLEQPYQATQSNQNFHLNELEKIKRMNDVSLKAMQNQIDMVKNELRNEMKTSIQTSLSNQTKEIKNMMASLLQMNTASTSGLGTLPGNTIANPKGELKAITTRSGLVTEGLTVPNPSKFVNPEEDECVDETYTDPDHVEYNIKVPPHPPVQKPKPLIQRNFVIHTRDSLPPHILIARDVFVPVGKFTFPADFVVVDYESDPKVPLILGRPFLRTAHARIDVHGEEMILHDGDKWLTLNMKHDTTSYSHHRYRDSVNLINILNLSNTDSFKDIHPYFDDDPLSGSTTYSANSLLEEFADELALISYPLDYDDDCVCDIESDIREIEFLLFQGEDSDFKDSINQYVLTHYDDLFIDPTPEMFTDEQPPDYSFPPRFDVDDVLFSPDNEDKVFNPGILSHEKSVKIITRVTQGKKLAVSFVSWLFEDFNPPFYELLIFKEVPNSMRLLPFSSKNKEKVFKPGIYTFKKFHCCFLSELSHPVFPDL